MASFHEFKEGHVWSRCCGLADCELCAGTGEARLEGHDAVLAGLSMLQGLDVWPALLTEMETQERAAMLELGRLRYQLQRLAQDALATVQHLERHYPEAGTLPSVQETRWLAEGTLGRRERVASEVS